MSEWDSISFAPQGWQCPICRRVYSPTTPMCYYCGNGVPYTVSSTTVGDAVIDWLHHESITKSEKPKEGMDIREIDGLWCDDITFCQEQCEWKSCPRNKQNIRDRTIPHSFSVEIPQDCPKKKGEMQE